MKPFQEKKFIQWIVGLVLIVFFLSACGASKTSSTSEPLRVEWTLWEGDYTILIAKEKGFFEKHGVNVDLVYYDDFYQAIPDLGGGKLDGGLFAIDNLILLSNVSDVAGVVVYDSGGTNALIGASDINSVTDLKGKKVGVTLGSVGEIFLRQVLMESGLSLKDVTLVNMDPEVIPQNIPDVIQAGYVWEPYTTEALQLGQNLLASTSYTTIESLTPDLIVFRRDIINNRPDDIQAFVNAWFEAVNYRLANPDECNQIIAKLTDQTVDDVFGGDARLFTREDNVSLFANNPGMDISSIYYSAQVNIDFMVSIGVLTQQPSLENILDPGFIR